MKQKRPQGSRRGPAKSGAGKGFSGKPGRKAPGKGSSKGSAKAGGGKGRSGGRADSRDDARGEKRNSKGKAPARHTEFKQGGFKSGGKSGGKPAKKGGVKKGGVKGANPDRGRESPRDSRPDTRRGPAPDSHLNKGRASIWGAHAVREAWLNPARTIRALYMTAEAEAGFREILDAARDAGLDRPLPEIVDKMLMDRITGRDAVHQGLALDAAPLEDVSVNDLICAAENRARAVIVMLDQVTDPHNVGAIMRSASAFDAVGMVMQRRHAPELDGVLVKTACGAAEYMPVAYETNLSRTLETLQEAGFFTLALDERGAASLEELPAYEKVVIVLGAEGPGIRRLVKEHCDSLVRLPTDGPIGALNVSNAAAVALYALTTAGRTGSNDGGGLF